MDEEKIYKVVGCGSFLQIVVNHGTLTQVSVNGDKIIEVPRVVYEFNFFVLGKVVKDLSKMPGVDTYVWKNIPDQFHIRSSAHALGILVSVKQGYFVSGLSSEKQIPSGCRQPSKDKGFHGYYNSTDMRTIFFASGPGMLSLTQHAY